MKYLVRKPSRAQSFRQEADGAGSRAKGHKIRRLPDAKHEGLLAATCTQAKGWAVLETASHNSRQ
jgi:hypothetical protein